MNPQAASVVSEWTRAVSQHVLGIDHIALAVADLEASVALYTGLLGFELIEQRETRGLRTGMRSAVVKAGPVTLVLVMGREPQSQVSRFVEHCGPGVQHIALRVDRLAPVAEALAARGAQFETPLIEGPFTRQLFTIRDPHLAVRLELIERTGEGFSDEPVLQLFLAMEAREVW